MTYGYPGIVSGAFAVKLGTQSGRPYSSSNYLMTFSNVSLSMYFAPRLGDGGSQAVRCGLPSESQPEGTRINTMQSLWNHPFRTSSFLTMM